jgi:hypothetical protein
MYSFLKTFEEKDVAVEVVTVVEVVEAATSREDSQASKIGVAEDVVKEWEVCPLREGLQFLQMLQL